MMKKIGFILKKIITAVKILLILIPTLLIADKLFGGKWIYPHVSAYLQKEKALSAPEKNTPRALEQTFQADLTPQPSIIQSDQAPDNGKIFIGSLPNPEKHQNTGIFYTAAFWKNATLNDIIQELENTADINARNPNGQTILMYAVSINKNPEVVNLLLMYGANLSARDNAGRTALMFASALNPNAEVVSRLIQAGASPSAKDQNGWSPLLYACAQNSNPDVIRLLLQNGSPINAQLPQADKPWHHASLENQLVSLTKIGLRNAQKFITNLYLATGEKTDYASVLEKSLDEMNDEINGSETGMTPLMIAGRYNSSPAIIEFLLQNGADVSLRDNKGKTVLDHAQENPNIYQTDVYWQMNDKFYNQIN